MSLSCRVLAYGHERRPNGTRRRNGASRPSTQTSSGTHPRRARRKAKGKPVYLPIVPRYAPGNARTLSAQASKRTDRTHFPPAPTNSTSPAPSGATASTARVRAGRTIGALTKKRQGISPVGSTRDRTEDQITSGPMRTPGGDGNRCGLLESPREPQPRTASGGGASATATDVATPAHVAAASTKRRRAPCMPTTLAPDASALKGDKEQSVAPPLRVGFSGTGREPGKRVRQDVNR